MADSIRQDAACKNLSLEEEARNTERSSNFWSSENKLRFSKVNFVSSGKTDTTITGETLERTFPSTTESKADAHTALEGLHLSQVHDSKSHDPLPNAKPSRATESSDKIHVPNTTIRDDGMAASGASFFIDLKGMGTSIDTGFPSPTIRAPSPSRSDSSAEIIIFTGRGRQYRETMEKTANISHYPSSPETSGVAHPPETNIERPASNPALTVASAPGSDASRGQNSSKKRSRRRKKRGNGRIEQREEDDALLADYIANMEEASDIEAAVDEGNYSCRDLGPSVNEQLATETGNEWDSTALHDLDDLSTSEEILDKIQHIISMRERRHGRQYLVVWQGYTVDDAKWIPASILTMDGASELIQKFEDEEKLVHRYLASDSSATSDEGLNEECNDGSNDDKELANDQRDLFRDKAHRMTDEQIARLLAKQEELGMGSDELLILDDTDGYCNNEALDNINGHGRAQPARVTRKLQGLKNKKRLRGEPPSAATIADAYDGFDVMEWERPSLQKKSKGRQANLPFELSDSELESAMQEAWAGDRDKKKAKKQEREELRAQGLLGRKNKFKADLKVKYPEGMTLDNIKQELKEFLFSSHET